MFYEYMSFTINTLTEVAAIASQWGQQGYHVISIFRHEPSVLSSSSYSVLMERVHNLEGDIE